MLWILLGFYLFGFGGGSAHLDHFYNDQPSLIKAEVTNSRRQENAQVFAGMVKNEINAFAKETAQNGKELKKLFQNYSSTPEQFDAVIQKGMDQQRQTFTRNCSEQGGAAESSHPGGMERDHRRCEAPGCGCRDQGCGEG